MLKIMIWDLILKESDQIRKASVKAKHNHGVKFVTDMVAELTVYRDNSIDILAVNSHGTEGWQGVGSGETGAASHNTDFTADLIPSNPLERLVTGGTVVEKPGHPLDPTLTTPDPLSGAEKGEVQRLLSIAVKIKPRGIFFLSGCSVGSGDTGRILLQQIGLSVQKSIMVVAPAVPTRMEWDNATRKITYTDNKTHLPLSSKELCGCMGARMLSADELADAAGSLVFSMA